MKIFNKRTKYYDGNISIVTNHAQKSSLQKSELTKVVLCADKGNNLYNAYTKEEYTGDKLFINGQEYVVLKGNGLDEGSVLCSIKRDKELPINDFKSLLDYIVTSRGFYKDAMDVYKFKLYVAECNHDYDSVRLYNHFIALEGLKRERYNDLLDKHNIKADGTEKIMMKRI